MDNQFPPVDAVLLRELERLFPNTLPDGPTTTEAFHILIGKQAVVRFLRAQYEDQTNPATPEE